jgi:hypothetical protein
MNYGRAGMSLDPGGVSFFDKSGTFQRSITAQSPYPCHTPLLWRIAVVNREVYWLQQNGWRYPCSGAEPDNIVWLHAADSSQEVLEATPAPGRALLADGSHIFWTDANATWRAARTGGPPEQLAPIGGSFLASDGNALFVGRDGVIERITAPGAHTAVFTGAYNDLFVDGAQLYVATNGGVVRQNGDCSGAMTVAAGGASSVTVDDRYVYFGATQIMRACK